MRKRPGRHRAGNFARAVDGSASPHSSVTRLVSLANALRNVPLRSTGPDGSLRQRLMAEAACPQPLERQSFWAEWLGRIRFQRGLATTTALATILLAAAGIGFGTTKSLPGDTLYAMKLRSETVQLALVGSAEERGRKNLAFADSRLDEITRLVQHKGAWPETKSAEAKSQPDAESVENLINRTFGTMDTSTAAGAQAMREAFERTGDTGPLAYLSEFVLRQQSELRDIMPKLPSGSQAAASDSLAYADELSEETTEILGTPGCSDASCDSQDRAASSTTGTPSEQTSSRSPTGKASSSTSADHTGATSTEPPTSSSTSEPTTGTGTGSGTDTGTEGTSGTGSSTDSDPTTSTPSSSSDSSSDTQSGESTESTPTSSPSPSSTPPSPTGVPTKPSGTKNDVSADTEGNRQSSPPAESDSSSSGSPPAESDSSSSGSPPAESDSSSSGSRQTESSREPAPSSSSQPAASGSPSGDSSDEPDASPSGSASHTGG